MWLYVGPTNPAAAPQTIGSGFYGNYKPVWPFEYFETQLLWNTVRVKIQ